MANNDIIVSYRQNDKTGMYVGIVVNVPSIVCQAPTMDKLNSRIKSAHDKYVKFLANKHNIVSKQF
jgi:predicted RNase H-like HicB family nuclease